MDADHFEALVAEALDSIPPDIQRYLDNVAVVIETWPRPHHLARLGLGPGSTLLGLYEGVPRTQRPAVMNLTLPDKITIFQGPIEMVTPGEGLARDAAIRREVRRVVLHEVAHHFGFGEDRLRELGY